VLKFYSLKDFQVKMMAAFTHLLGLEALVRRPLLISLDNSKKLRMSRKYSQRSIRKKCSHLSLKILLWLLQMVTSLISWQILCQLEKAKNLILDAGSLMELNLMMIGLDM
jgi:hypothetical protein